MISKFFIERPVLANVLAILMILIGAVALNQLPVALYQRRAAHGAGPGPLPERQREDHCRHGGLADPQQVNGVENMLYMPSTCSSDGS